MTRALLAAALVAAAGCDAAEPGGSRSERSDSGVLHVTNSGSGSWSPDERWTARVGMRVGNVDGDGPAGFGSIAGLAVDADRRVYVLDQLAAEVRVFDDDGTSVRAFGRAGAGPGEFQRASGVLLDDRSAGSSTVWVWDLSNSRYVLFSEQGEFLRTVPRIASRSATTPWPASFDEAGRLIDWDVYYPQAIRAPDYGTHGFLIPVRLLSSDGAVDTLPRIRFDQDVAGAFPLPFGNRPLVHHGGNAVWLASSREYEIRRQTYDGDTLIVIRLEGHEPAPLTDDVADSVVASYPPLVVQTPTHDDLPATRPVLLRMITDDAGHLLVFPELAMHDAGTAIDVFDIDSGEYRGRVELPVVLDTGITIRARGGSIYGVTRDQFDVQYVVRIDLTPAAAASGS